MKNEAGLATKISSLFVALAAWAGLSCPAQADEIQSAFNLAVRATSAPIAVPGTNTPVTMTCASNTSGFRGIGQATILRPYPNEFLEWVGMDIATGAIPWVIVERWEHTSFIAIIQTNTWKFRSSETLRFK